MTRLMGPNMLIYAKSRCTGYNRLADAFAVEDVFSIEIGTEVRFQMTRSRRNKRYEGLASEVVDQVAWDS